MYLYDVFNSTYSSISNRVNDVVDNDFSEGTKGCRARKAWKIPNCLTDSRSNAILFIDGKWDKSGNVDGSNATIEYNHSSGWDVLFGSSSSHIATKMSQCRFDKNILRSCTLTGPIGIFKIKSIYTSAVVGSSRSYSQKGKNFKYHRIFLLNGTLQVKTDETTTLKNDTSKKSVKLNSNEYTKTMKGDFIVACSRTIAKYETESMGVYSKSKKISNLSKICSLGLYLLDLIANIQLNLQFYNGIREYKYGDYFLCQMNQNYRLCRASLREEDRCPFMTDIPWIEKFSTLANWNYDNYIEYMKSNKTYNVGDVASRINTNNARIVSNFLPKVNRKGFRNDNNSDSDNESSDDEVCDDTSFGLSAFECDLHVKYTLSDKTKEKIEHILNRCDCLPQKFALLSKHRNRKLIVTNCCNNDKKDISQETNKTNEIDEENVSEKKNSNVDTETKDNKEKKQDNDSDQDNNNHNENGSDKDENMHLIHKIEFNGHARVSGETFFKRNKNIDFVRVTIKQKGKYIFSIDNTQKLKNKAISQGTHEYRIEKFSGTFIGSKISFSSFISKLKLNLTTLDTCANLKGKNKGKKGFFKINNTKYRLVCPNGTRLANDIKWLAGIGCHVITAEEAQFHKTENQQIFDAICTKIVQLMQIYTKLENKYSNENNHNNDSNDNCNYNTYSKKCQKFAFRIISEFMNSCNMQKIMDNKFKDINQAHALKTQNIPLIEHCMFKQFDLSWIRNGYDSDDDYNYVRSLRGINIFGSRRPHRKWNKNENGCDEQGWNILHYGAYLNNYQYIGVIRQSPTKSTKYSHNKDIGGNKPIHIACQYGHLNILKFFINNENDNDKHIIKYKNDQGKRLRTIGIVMRDDEWDWNDKDENNDSDESEDNGNKNNINDDSDNDNNSKNKKSKDIKNSDAKKDKPDNNNNNNRVIKYVFSSSCHRCALVESKNREGWTPVAICIIYNKPDCLRLLLAGLKQNNAVLLDLMNQDMHSYFNGFTPYTLGLQS